MYKVKFQFFKSYIKYWETANVSKIHKREREIEISYIIHKNKSNIIVCPILSLYPGMHSVLFYFYFSVWHFPRFTTLESGKRHSTIEVVGRILRVLTCAKTWVENGSAVMVVGLYIALYIATVKNCWR